MGRIMSVLAFFVILIGLALSLNVIMTLGLIRRLRQIHHSVAEWIPSGRYVPLPDGLPIGEVPPSFSVTDLDGEVISEATLAGQISVLGFFAASCESCRLYLPRLRDLSKQRARDLQSLVVIDGDAAHAGDLITVGRETGRVVTGELNTGMSGIFKVHFYPTFYVVDESGKVAFGSNSVDDLERYLAA
jgi:thiol-disulfide isomerase/thioredoxin